MAPLEVSPGVEPIHIRRDFNALAVFAPSVLTDTNGQAEVKVKLPDSLTRYRVMAVAVAGGKQFGSGESSITARKPLMVRASAPRFLNFGDAFEFPVVVQNQTDAAMSVDIALRASNARLSGMAGSSSGRRVTVPANDRVEVRMPVTTATAGRAWFQVAAVVWWLGRRHRSLSTGLDSGNNGSICDLRRDRSRRNQPTGESSSRSV